MQLKSGVRLGPYEVVSAIGAGGMGQVWKAVDTRLDRSVAIKVLPAEFAANAQLRIRFEREAKTISQLSHPNICTLFDVGDGYLVMELLEGESLADRIAKGPLPLDQVIRYGIEIAAALERAHKSGIVHRDLKPANVMLTKTGAKLLDFGLAKGVSLGTVDGATQNKNLTAEGTIVGTFQYMAPEQIDGRDSDARTDIFALGALLYEMATGRRAFQGNSRASLIAAIMATEPPPIGATQPASPAALDRIVRICLAKEPDDRWQSAHDVAIELRDMRDAATATRAARPQPLGWIVAAIAIAAAAGFGWMAFHKKSAPPLMIEGGISVPDSWLVRWPRLSPSGTKLAFVGISEAGETALFVRDMASGVTTKLAVTEPGGTPEWSPDGTQFLINEPGGLFRVSPESGTSQLVSHDKAIFGYAWGPNGVILIGNADGIFRSDTMQPVIRPDAAHGEVSVGLPSFLPDGKHFLYNSVRKTAQQPLYSICVGSLDGNVRKQLMAAGTDGRFSNGYIVFGQGGKLMAQRFDLANLQLAGEPDLIADELMGGLTGAEGAFTVAENGVLIYRRSASNSAASKLAWYDMSGHEISTFAPIGQYWDMSLSRDGRSVLTQVTKPQETGHIWSFDIARGVGSLVTPQEQDMPRRAEATPEWMPDGHSFLFCSGGAGFFDISLKTLSGNSSVVFRNGLRNYVCDVSADGNTALITTAGPFGGGNHYSLGALTIATGKLTPLGPPDSDRLNAKFSPDQKWIAYASTDTGRREVYVASYPDLRVTDRVSSRGGQMPYWSPDGKKLYFASGDLRQILVADVAVHGGAIDVAEPRVIANVRVKRSENTQFVVTPDGQRLLVNAVDNDVMANPLTLVTNWMARVQAK